MGCPCLLGSGAVRPLGCPRLCPRVRQCSELPASAAEALWRGHSATRSVSPDAASTHTQPPAPPRGQALLYYSQRVGCYTAVCQPGCLPAGLAPGDLTQGWLPTPHSRPYHCLTDSGYRRAGWAEDPQREASLHSV